MAVEKYTSNTIIPIFNAGTYRVIAIGPGGNGGTGGKSTGSNSSTSGTVTGADGGGGGAGAIVYVGELSADFSGPLAISITQNSTELFGVLKLSIPKAGSGTTISGGNPAVPLPGASVYNSEGYSGSRGGGAGAPFGTRGNTITPTAMSGGAGNISAGGNATLGALSGTYRDAGTPGIGGNNAASENNQPRGGTGAKDNQLIIDETNILTLTAQDIAAYINGGNGGGASAPSKRAATTGMPGGQGGGGGGAWTSGKNGSPSGPVGQGKNGDGGLGGVGGTGAVWLMPID